MGKKGAQAQCNAHLFQECFPTCIATPDPLGGAGEIHSSLASLSFLSRQPHSSHPAPPLPVDLLTNYRIEIDEAGLFFFFLKNIK